MSSSGGEMRGFVFAVIFIVVFSTLLVSIPAGLQGPNEDVSALIAIDPNLLTGFAESENFTTADMDQTGDLYSYEYNLGGNDWLCFETGYTFQLAAKVRVLGAFWFGGLDYCKFIAPSGTSRGTILDFDKIGEDAEDGAVRYSLEFTDSGNTAGSFVFYWNTTAYYTVYDAWDAEELYMIHGVGIEDTATANVAALLISLLFLQIPEVPALVNVFIVIPVWACIIYVLWFIIKEMIPFL